MHHHCDTSHGHGGRMVLAFLVFLLVSLSAIILGLQAFGIDIFTNQYIMPYTYPIKIVLGISGILGLFFYASECKGHCKKECESCRVVR